MKKKNYKNMNENEIKNSLTSLYKERFKLLIEKSNGTQFKKNHLLKKIKIDIARILTFKNEQKREV